ANEAFLRACISIVVPSAQERMELMRRVRKTHASSTPQACNSETEVKVTPQTPYMEELVDGGRFLADPDGQRRFIGNASGAAFLDQLREFASTVLPLVCGKNGSLRHSQIQDSFSNLLGRYQTHDSRPLQLPVVDPYYLPPIEETQRCLSLLSKSTGDMEDVSIFYWGPLTDTMRQVYSKGTANTYGEYSIQLATLNAALALAAQQSPAGALGSETGDTYFAHARFLLGSPLDSATRMHIPCLAMMGYYLLGANRRDAAYSYIRLAGHIAVTYGYYQSWMTSETERREFWTIYALDRFLSCLLGRPAMISDENISVDFPQDVPGLPRAAGLKLHVKLARILGRAVEKIYGYGGRGSKHPGLAHIYHFLDELEDWRSQMHSSLSIDRCLGPEPPRDLLTLHMAYNQVTFSAVRQNVARSFLANSAKFEPPDHHLLKICTEAASENVKLTNRLFKSVSSGSSAFGMIDYHTAFNAAIILELGFLCRDSSASMYDRPQIGHVLDVLQHAGFNGNEFARDCSTVLSDFRHLCERLMQEMSRRIPANISFAPLASSAQTSGNLPPGAFEIPASSVMGFALDECLSPGLDLDRVLEEFSSWLEEEPF
ncbi:hypothetical protein PENARI_c090G01433, partial [Penicillium arizonense]